jgi:hypothetical protein
MHITPLGAEGGGMKVSELIEALKALDPELEVFFRAPHLCGTIKPVDTALQETYGFFGCSIPCVILDEQLEESPDENS